MLLLCCLAASIFCTNPSREPPGTFNPTLDVEQITSFRSIYDPRNPREFLEKAEIVLKNTIKKYEDIDSLGISQIVNSETDQESCVILKPIVKSIKGWETMVRDAQELAQRFDIHISSITLKEVSKVFCLGLRCRLVLQKVACKRIKDEKPKFFGERICNNVLNHVMFRDKQDAKLDHLIKDLNDVVNKSADNSGDYSESHTNEQMEIIKWMIPLVGRILNLNVDPV